MIFNYLGIIEEILTRKSAANSRAKDVSVPDVVNVYAKRNRSSDSVSVVCHGTLPAGIPADTTPQ
ncbi:unnamed protein product, partial [Pylaiella littoralis]